MDKVALTELVLDELVGGARIRHAQQGFRQHHQRQALLGGECEFAQHLLDSAEPIVIGSDGPDQARRRSVDPAVLFRAQPCRGQKPGRDGAVIVGVRRLEGWKKSGFGCHDVS
jgi:hypothetical protein